MELAITLAGVLGALAIGAMTPGPSFVLVARMSVAASRRDGVMAALGMGLGGVVFAALALLGLHAALLGVPWLYLTLKVAGGIYLATLAVRMWRGAKEPLPVPAESPAAPATRSLSRSFLTGLLTQLSNPKTAVVYGSIFAALLPADLPRTGALALPVLVFLVEAGWYCVVAYALSAETSRHAYLRSKSHVDRVAGSVMGLLGLKLITAARPGE